ncbi:unnamed protein product [Bursaphelenchus okinawaensis]|uniref:Malate dehydrogenase n=1 Tax=Bursaphelenchus okinawaensis TaxID=465554 RepID=A0A811LF42_9BILA|nr:unnamed protein product [Bursaphelenchus okinawaensis]CAG9121992.1 unnamed protein product [Bursaphelenchus okinawaensis]
MTKVVVIGAAGGIGQPLSLLLKQNDKIGHLALYDVVNTLGVAADLSHIDTTAKVTGHTGPSELKAALKDADIIVIPAGVPRKPGMTRDDLFNINAGIIKGIAEATSEVAPKALVALITNPVNSTVPIFVEVLKKNGVYDHRRVFGVTTLDIVRAQTFVGEKSGNVKTIPKVPVIGGHAGITIIPLLTQTKPPVKLSEDEVKNLTVRIQDAGTEVVKAKAGAGSATLSMAFAAARFVNSLLKALNGEQVLEHAYINTNVVQDVDYFSTPLLLSRNGIERTLGLGELSEFEKKLVSEAVPELQKNIQKGVGFVKAKL